jgi:hypothetical protein
MTPVLAARAKNTKSAAGNKALNTTVKNGAEKMVVEYEEIRLNLLNMQNEIKEVGDSL